MQHVRDLLSINQETLLPAWQVGVLALLCTLLLSMVLVLSWCRAAQHRDSVPPMWAAHRYQQELRKPHDFSRHAMARTSGHAAQGEEGVRSEFHLAPNLPKSQDLIQCEIRVHSNNTSRQCRRPASAPCKICGGKAIVLVRDLPFTIDGHLLDVYWLNKGMSMHIDLSCGIRQVVSDGSTDVHMLKKLGEVTLNSHTGPVFHVCVPAMQLEPSREAISAVKKTQGHSGQFCQIIVAVVKVVRGDGCLSIPTIYHSPELYACSRRNIHKQCNPGPYGAREYPPKPGKMALSFLVGAEDQVDLDSGQAPCTTPRDALVLDLNAPPQWM